jgi:hypothetical protein
MIQVFGYFEWHLGWCFCKRRAYFSGAWNYQFLRCVRMTGGLRILDFQPVWYNREERSNNLTQSWGNHHILQHWSDLSIFLHKYHKCHYFFCMSLISKNHWRVFTMFLQCLNQFGHGQDFQPQGRTKCRRLTGMQWCRQVLSAPASISMTGWNWMELDGDFDAQKHSLRHVSSTVL